MSATTSRASGRRRDGARNGERRHWWPAVVALEPGDPDPALITGVEELLTRDAAAHLALRVDDGTLVLLLAQAEATAERAFEVRLVVEQVAALVRARRDGAHVRAVIARSSVPPAAVGARVERLRRLIRCQRSDGTSAGGVCSESSLALVELLGGADQARAAAFVRGQIGALLAHDRTYGTRLADVLEIALDEPHRSDAARAAYMHRNTFRRYLRRAADLLDGDLSDPDERLAVHVALKLVRAAPRGLTTSGTRPETPR